MYVAERADCGGGRCARSSEPLAAGDVVARDTAIDFERVRTGVESWSCVSCGRFLGHVTLATPSSTRDAAREGLVDTSEQTCALPELVVVRGRDGETLAMCASRRGCAWRRLADGRRGATFEGVGEVDFSAFETPTRDGGDEEDEELEYYERVEALAARLYACELLEPEGARTRALGEKHSDVKGLERAFVERASAAVSALKDALASVDGARDVEPTEEGWLRVVSAAAMNSVAVKIPNPMLRYIACLDAESEDVRATAMRTLRPALEEMVRQAKERDDGDDDGDDGKDEDDDGDGSSSDDEDAAYRDEVMEFDWGDGLRFSSDLFPSSEGIALLGACSAINHSCEPNCEVGFIDSTDVIIIATRDIDEDEEITIAYVPEELPVEQRREELSTRYGFECQCARCERELAKRARVDA